MEKLDGVFGDALQQRYVHCLSFLVKHSNGLFVMPTCIRVGWWLTCLPFRRLFFGQTSEFPKQTHAHRSNPPSPTQKGGLIAAGAKRIADVWRGFGGALLFLCLLLRQQPIPYPFGADCRGQRQSRSGFRRQLEANRQNGGHFGYMGPTRVPESHLDGLRTVCGLHN